MCTGCSSREKNSMKGIDERPLFFYNLYLKKTLRIQPNLDIAWSNLLVCSWNLVISTDPFQYNKEAIKLNTFFPYAYKVRDASRSYCMISTSVIGKLITKAILCIRETDTNMLPLPLWVLDEIHTYPDLTLPLWVLGDILHVLHGRSADWHGSGGELRYTVHFGVQIGMGLGGELNLAWSREVRFSAMISIGHAYPHETTSQVFNLAEQFQRFLVTLPHVTPISSIKRVRGLNGNP
ncbi:hypothetical protein L195_g019598 [Trifolium pratense]|uniref:Uncharacterized protein n=1 Tax=Trifolium pratense TaxID=57577 RepID=A0A2K3N047_TRIPR|nr:hypothetical protein L195_g019598 [Trifolium pratense]